MIPLYPLLGLLARGERHGYEIKRAVDDEFAPFWRIDFAQLYRSLAKMTEAGWVKARVETSERGPARKVYALTARGRKELDAWLTTPARDHVEGLVKLRFAAARGMPVAPLLATQRRTLEKARAAHVQRQRAARESGDVGQLAFANAAQRDVEGWLVTLDLTAALISPPEGAVTAARLTQPLAITGSDDPLILYLAQRTRAAATAVGSIGGLLALSQHDADVAGIHLLDAETGEYNVPFVKHLLPEEESVLVNLAIRENGLMLAPGNPKGIRALCDLARPEIRFINRQRGAGTRLLLFSKLRAAGINPHALANWERAVSTHAGIADAITAGIADVGPGLRAVAYAHGLDFMPLGVERYDLVIPRAEFESERIRALLDAIASPEFRHTGEALPGYDLAQTGHVIAQVR